MLGTVKDVLEEAMDLSPPEEEEGNKEEGPIIGINVVEVFTGTY